MTRVKVLRTVSTTLVWVLALVYSIPTYLLIAISLKTPAEIAECALCLPLAPQWSNFADAWGKTAGTSAPNLGVSMINSAIITGIAVVLIVVIGAAAGWFLGRSRSRRSTLVYLGVLAAITVPVQLVIIPVYVAMSQIGILGTLVPTALFYVGLLTPFAVFLCTGFVRALPLDFEEAAQLDGASQIRIFWHIVLPAISPVLSTVAILAGIAVWNDFFGQLVFLLGSGNETLPLTVFNFASQYATQYNLLAAGLVIATVPLVVFYLLMQKRIVDGFAGGIKG